MVCCPQIPRRYREASSVELSSLQNHGSDTHEHLGPVHEVLVHVHVSGEWVISRGGPTCVHESLQVLVHLAWTLSRDRNDINALNL